MQSQAYSPRWSTAAISDAADTSPMELSELGEHVNRCNGMRGRWFALHCIADTVQTFVSARFVTTLAIVGGVVVITALAF
ncbi:MAG: hypothetical protein M3O01_03970 [Pseudomonadota bacterium]|nr:hypothetical protein [Pseudomonadota bacterium]